MVFRTFGAGLTPGLSSAAETTEIEDVATEEAAIRTPGGAALRITPLVKEGDAVAQGAAVACLRDAPDMCFVAPFAGRVARISLLPGRKLSEVVLFREPTGAVETHETSALDSVAALRRGMQRSGLWPWLRRRPFGGMPAPEEKPAAIFVVAADTRPFAPDPRQALAGRDEEFARGVSALLELTEGPVFICQSAGPPLLADSAKQDRVRCVRCGPRHPQAAVGLRIHQLFPAGLDTPVWDIHAEDVAALGAWRQTGVLPMARLVHIAGAGLRQSRWVRTHPGADLRQLTQRIVLPGAHVLMSGSPLDGHVAHWLAPRHRQITVLPQTPPLPSPHWLIKALTRSAVGRPAIPTAALTHAFGAGLPAAAFVRALGAGEDEAAMRLGLLSLLEEDVALADYVLSEGGKLTAGLRAMLDRIEQELAV